MAFDVMPAIGRAIEFAEKQHLSFTVVQNIGCGLAIQSWIERYADVPCCPDGQIGQNPVGAVFAQNPDIASLRQPQRVQVGGHARHLVGGFTPGNIFNTPVWVGLGQKNVVGSMLCPVIKAMQ